MGDANLLARLSGVDFTAEEVKYHSCCRIKYQTEAEGKHNQEKHMAGVKVAFQKQVQVSGI